MKKNLLIYPGFVTDTWCSIEQRYLWLVGPLDEHFNVYWLVPPAGSKHTRCREEGNRSKEPIYVTRLKEKNARIIEADISKYNLFGNLILLRKILKKHRIDAVTQWFSPLGYYLELTAKLCEVPVFRKEHTFTFAENRKYKIVKYWFWKWTTSYYITNSIAVARHLIDNRVVTAGNSTVVYNAFDISSYPTARKEESRGTLLHEFNLSPDTILLGCVAESTEANNNTF
jgi:hypothetical protein